CGVEHNWVQLALQVGTPSVRVGSLFVLGSLVLAPVPVALEGRSYSRASGFPGGPLLFLCSCCPGGPLLPPSFRFSWRASPVPVPCLLEDRSCSPAVWEDCLCPQCLGDSLMDLGRVDAAS
ncbi:hypothetical protein D4764_0288910, partial [Takifugu flavidus]